MHGGDRRQGGQRGCLALDRLHIPVKKQAYAAFCMWVTFYALWTVLGREMSETGPKFKPLLFLFLRNILAFVVLVCMGLLTLTRNHKRILPDIRRTRPRDLALIVGLGASIWLNQLFYIYGLRFTTATNAAILESCIPVYTTIFGLAFGIEKLGSGLRFHRRLFGIVLCTGGAIFVILASARAREHLGHHSARKVFGNVLLWVSTVMLAIYMHLQKPLARKYDALQLSIYSQFVCMILSSLVMLFVIAFMEFDGYETWSKWVPERSFWWALSYAVLFVSCINFTVETWAIHRSSASTAALFMTLEPALTASLSWIILREPIRWQAVVGAVVVVVGLLLSLPNSSLIAAEKLEEEPEKTVLFHEHFLEGADGSTVSAEERRALLQAHDESDEDDVEAKN